MTDISIAQENYTLAFEYFRTNRLNLAEKFAINALNHAPHYAQPYNILGMIAQQRGHPRDALKHYTAAIERKRDFAEAISNCANVLENIGRTMEAEAMYRRAINLSPHLAPAYYCLGSILRDRADYKGARDLYRKAAELAPDNASVGIGLIYALDMDPDAAEEEALEARRQWYKKFELRHYHQHYNNLEELAADRDPDRRLRLGYVSADFRQHSAAYAWGPVVTGHGERFDVTYYNNSATSDHMTDYFKQQPNVTWCDVASLTDAEFAWKVFRDEIDILVDLSGYTSGTRLRAMTAKPAPVQAHGWGYILPLGIPEIDFQFTDEVIGDFGSGIGCLPSAFHFRPPAEAPAVDPVPPVARNGYVTFGYLGRYSRVTPETAAIWATILRRLPSSRLLLKDRAFSHVSRVAMVRQRFPHDVQHRLDFMSLSGLGTHLGVHNSVDVCLDPFPVGGGITVLEALHMDCPIVTLRGQRMVSRAGASIATAAGFEREFVVADHVSYVSRALDLAAGCTARTRPRGTIRRALAQSPVCNTPEYVAHVERAYRQAWKRYCHQGQRP